MRTLLSFSALLLVFSLVYGGDAPADKHTKAIAPFVDGQTFLVGHLDVSRLDIDLIAKHMQALGHEKKDLEMMKAVATLAKTTFLGAGGKDIYVLMNWAYGIDEILFMAPLGKDAVPQAIATLVKQIPNFEAEWKDGVLLAGNKKVMAKVKNFKAEAVPDFAKAFAAVGEGTVRIVVVPPFALKKSFAENFPVLPKEVGGGNTSVLDFLWGAAKIDLATPMGVKIVVKAPTAKGAEDIGKLAERALELGRSDKEVLRAFPDFDKIKQAFVPKVEGDRLTVTLNDGDLTNVLVPLLQKQRAAAGRAVSVNNLKQMAIAMHNYASVFKSLPPAATYDAKGKSLLSWRVHILPFVEQDNLYRQFHLDEPWDSEHNKKLIAQMPETYKSPAQKNAGEGKTTYLVPVGTKTIFEGKKGMQFRQITDGTSNTILIVEVDDSRAVYWTQPEDYKIDDKNPKAGLVRPGAKGFNAAIADGSVRFIHANIGDATLRAAFSAWGGEILGEDW